ncbi:MAG: putative toxin-antitoxin system toxin component, PIN family [Ferruginibacter sp.]
MYPVIFDANVWIKYARAKNIAPLLDRIVSYQFLPIVNNYLLSEIFDALVDNKWMDKRHSSLVIEYIKKLALVTSERVVYKLSPDPKDNYLFDLAIQNNCVFIITDDTKLLQLKLKPLPVHSTSWFLKKFPVH